MKYILPAWVLGCFLFSCTPKKSVVHPSSSDSTLIQKQIVNDYFAAFNAHDWSKMCSYYADSVDMKDPAYGTRMLKMSRLEIEKKYQELQSTIPDVHDEIDQMYFCGNRVVVEFVSTGTAPDGSKMELPICTIFTLKDGKISGDYTYYDNF